MVDREQLNDHVLKPVMEYGRQYQLDGRNGLKVLKEQVLAVSEVSESAGYEELVEALLLGNTLLFAEGSNRALILGVRNPEGRSITESNAERTLRGPKEAFIEKLDKNINMIRSRIRDPQLAVEVMTVGERTKTRIALVYLKSTARPDMVERIRSRIKSIKVNAILSSSQVEQQIEGHKWSVFPQAIASDRPDKLSSSVLEGRVVVIVDGTPFALIVPVTFAMFLNSTDDYFERSITTSIIRAIRYVCYLIASTFPALYLALTSYHPGMLPTPLALYITSTRIGLPFPTFVEIIFMQFTLEVLLEAAIRLPRAVGQTVSIVGGLVIGQSVVQAGLVSPVIVIVVSLTAISTFVLPVYAFALSNRAIRIPMILAAAFFGLYGIIMVWLFILIHMASLESFGVRYFEDFSPYGLKKVKDTFLKVPDRYLNDVPVYLRSGETSKTYGKKEAGGSGRKINRY
jgi:hypothetical protein